MDTGGPTLCKWCIEAERKRQAVTIAALEAEIARLKAELAEARTEVIPAPRVPVEA